MGKKKSKKDRKREERDQRRQAEEEALEAHRARRLKYRVASAIVPLLTAGVALGVYYSMDDQQLAALIGMVGGAITIPIVLGAIGGDIEPRDRNRAGSIDFGNRG